MGYASNDRNHQPNAVVRIPAPARSSFLRSRATLKPLKIFVHAAGRGPTCSSAMHQLLRTESPADIAAGQESSFAKGHYMVQAQQSATNLACGKYAKRSTKSEEDKFLAFSCTSYFALGT